MYKYLLYFAMTFSIASGALEDSDIDWDLLDRFDIKGKMHEHKVVPTLFAEAPELTCHAHFRWGEPEPGQTLLTDEDKVAKPTVTWPHDNDTLYLLFANCYRDWHLIQNDTEYARTHSPLEYHEWLVYNIHNLFLHKADYIYDYRPCPEPEDKNVRQLIVYLVFKQNGRMKIPMNAEITPEEFEERRHLNSFVKKYNLGNPVAGNFYYVRYDDQRGIDDNI